MWVGCQTIAGWDCQLITTIYCRKHGTSHYKPSLDWTYQRYWLGRSNRNKITESHWSSFFADRSYSRHHLYSANNLSKIQSIFSNRIDRATAYRCRVTNHRWQIHIMLINSCGLQYSPWIHGNCVEQPVNAYLSNAGQWKCWYQRKVAFVWFTQQPWACILVWFRRTM